mmetsp:Transcript_27977/g.41321  ORF Transcript_27977/g.41321 Transcript_27977/m.41321 type:complete len:124 (+) Transcript_27977:76-447(+)|eukprot:CAMPEP_0194199226 /NCGR_PEP_ID=MMETSP0156-20130528/320_1 /TAXON_ID=33649 /ORGANISM="Thalassionema nitzschioides, Strain L26-B" /LENGTH=123 /DNA_ID=CAMNT_0038924087 /DNA_START=44 /DNA_END=415 /DNA_ORIENTATION=+
MVEDKDPVESAIDKLKPVLSKLSFGAVAGYTSGYATKKIGKAAAFVAGVGFIIFQSLAVAGYIDIDWLKIKDDAVKSIDTDGDGELTTKDIKNYWRKFKSIMTSKLPDAGGFSLGFLYGVRHG